MCTRQYCHLNINDLLVAPDLPCLRSVLGVLVAIKKPSERQNVHNVIVNHIAKQIDFEYMNVLLRLTFFNLSPVTVEGWWSVCVIYSSSPCCI